ALWRVAGRTIRRRGASAVRAGWLEGGVSSGWHLPRGVVVGGADRLRDAVGVREDPVPPRLPVVVLHDLPRADTAVPVGAQPAERPHPVQEFGERLGGGERVPGDLGDEGGG